MIEQELVYSSVLWNLKLGHHTTASSTCRADWCHSAAVHFYSERTYSVRVSVKLSAILNEVYRSFPNSFQTSSGILPLNGLRLAPKALPIRHLREFSLFIRCTPKLCS